MIYLKNVDTVKALLELAQRVEQQRSEKDPIPINDRDRWWVTLLVGILTDPNHKEGQIIARSLYRVWLDRGGKPMSHGAVAITDIEQLEHAVMYLVDMDISYTDIQRALSITYYDITRIIKKHEGFV